MTAQTDRLNAALDGRYRILRHLGEGGMATVYLCDDLKHDRKVALKLLKPELAAVLGAERFVQEIKTTAALQHPHILPLFDSGAADGFLFYVMPFIDGETLRAKLDRETQLGVDDAVRIAREVLDALHYAHERGIVHRDVKPENILLHGGHAMVADFGIALAVSAAAGGRMTETGLSLGTPHYMSPEQATAEKEITARSDVYSLGSVLYEMLTGNPPYTGANAQQIIMKIITEPAEAVTKYRKSVPPNVAAAVAKSLEKLPADRFESAKAFAEALGNASYTNVAHTSGAPSGASARASRSALISGGVLAIIGITLAAWAWTARGGAHGMVSDESPVLRVTLTKPADLDFADGVTGTNVAISPRGDRIAFVATKRGGLGNSLWIRASDHFELKELVGTNGIRTPAFSPDGKWIAFVEGVTVKKVSADGGPVTTLATLTSSLLGLSWGVTGALFVGVASNGLFIIPANGGEPRGMLKTADPQDRWPLALPDGKTVVFAKDVGGVRTLALASIAEGTSTSLGILGNSPLALLNGQLVYVTATGSLMAIGFDGKQVSTDAPTTLATDVFLDALGGAKAAVATMAGTLLYRSGKSESEMVTVGKSGGVLGLEKQNFVTPRFSPDGKSIAYGVAPDIWVYDRVRGTKTRITTDGTNDRPEWSPDGKRLLFTSTRGDKHGYWLQPTDGSGPAELLYSPEQGDPFEAVMSKDGKWLVYRTGPAASTPRSIFAVPLTGAKKVIPMVLGNTAGTFIQMPRLSPDDHWLAYQSNESGRFEVYVRPFPDAGGRVTISAGGGTEPLWSRDGHTLYYRVGNDVVAVKVATGATLSVGERNVVATGNYSTNPSHPNWDVSPDGSEFLMLRHAGEEVQVILVQNWGREVAALTAAKSAK